MYKRFFKRALDFLCSGLAILCLSPVLAVIAVWVKASSPGPVLFTQKRVGKGKTFFKIYKFRTMRTDTPHDMPTHMLENPDAFITSAGRFLRRTSLDELPQLLNILMGQMSFVGTRPEVPCYVRQYTPQMLATLLLPAGVTSQASIRYKDEDRLLDSSADPDRTYVEQVLPGKMEYNLNSLLDFSLWQDFKTMVQTVGAVLH